MPVNMSEPANSIFIFGDSLVMIGFEKNGKQRAIAPVLISGEEEKRYQSFYTNLCVKERPNSGFTLSISTLRYS